MENNTQNTVNSNDTLNWQGTPLEFTELTKALILSKKLNPELNQAKVFSRMRALFNVDDYNEGDKLKDIRKRTKDSTPLINTLETSLTNWINKED